MHRSLTYNAQNHRHIDEFPEHEDYPGFYFREAYVNAVKSIRLDVDTNSLLHPNRLPEITQTLRDANILHVKQSMQRMNMFKTERILDNYIDKKVTLPHSSMKKLAIFDLDETLIHCIPEKGVQSDTGSSVLADADVVLTCKYDWFEDTMPINIRPFFKACLLEIKKYYQVIVFTASRKEYADTILNYLDPHHELIEARFYRDSC